MFTSEKFIKLIQERPTIWDKKSGFEHAARDVAWTEVGEEMFSDWSQLSSDEREEKVKLMKCKWRNLRDKYLRSLKCDKRKKDVILEHMDFLLDTYGHRVAIQDKPGKKTETVKGKKNAHSNGRIDSESNNAGNESCSSETSEDTVQLKKAQPKSSSTKKSQNTKLTTLKPKPPIIKPKLPTLESSVSPAKQIEGTPKEEDADTMFFNSLLPDYKDLDDEEKLDFRIKCLQFIRDARKRNS